MRPLYCDVSRLAAILEAAALDAPPFFRWRAVSSAIYLSPSVDCNSASYFVVVQRPLRIFASTTQAVGENLIQHRRRRARIQRAYRRMGKPRVGGHHATRLSYFLTISIDNFAGFFQEYPVGPFRSLVSGMYDNARCDLTGATIIDVTLDDCCSSLL